MPRFGMIFACLTVCLFSADGFAAPAKPASTASVKAAVDAAMRDDWGKAASLARKSSDAKLVKLVEWLRLTRKTDGVAIDDMTRFMAKNPHFPRIYMIRRNAEAALLKQNNTAALGKWFKKYPPVSPAAVLKHAELLMAKKEWERAIPMLYNLWAKSELSDEETALVQEKLTLLLDTHDYAARVETLLNERKAKQAAKLAPFIDNEARKLADVRIGLINNAAHAVRKIKDLPAEQRKSAGLLFDELRWLRNKGKYDDAAKLLKNAPTDAQSGERWWNERVAIARQMLNADRAEDAYALVKNHALSAGGGSYADAEWLAGWIALRDLKKNKTARQHFANMLDAVKSPVSIARGEYWTGRAFEESGNKSEARKWYQKSAQHITTIYGQLAAQKLKEKFFPALPSENAPTLEQMTKIRQNELFQIAALAQQAEQNELTDVFAARLLADSKSSDETTALAYAFAEDLRRPDLAVNIARRARASGTYIVSLGYPVWDLKHDERAEQAIVLSIIRQESNFSTDAVSPAGARGLMQILPSTAKQIARRKKKPFSASMLNSNPDFNVEMGSTYFADMLKRFDGSYILAVAAYNAGPTNVRKWVKTLGKPDENLDAVDWIERIPFNETRNYVQRVLENLHIYRRHLNYPDEALNSWAQATAQKQP